MSLLNTFLLVILIIITIIKFSMTTIIIIIITSPWYTIGSPPSTKVAPGRVNMLSKLLSRFH